MPETVYRMMAVLCALVTGVPVGTNLGLLHLLWMLASGRLLASRGALFAGLGDCGLSARAVRRAWAALGQGGWTSGQLLARWAAVVAAEGRWQPHAHGGYHPVAVDVICPLAGLRTASIASRKRWMSRLPLIFVRSLR